VRTTSHINDFTAQEMRSYWYSQAEIREIRNDLGATLQLIEMEIDVSSSKEFCARGLEHLSREGARRRSEIKKRGWHAAVAEQELQRSKGICDQQRLADVYFEHVQDSEAAAIVRGLADMREACLSFEGFHKLDDALEVGPGNPWSTSSSGNKTVLFGRIQYHILSTRAA
jgi:hypothetical protein